MKILFKLKAAGLIPTKSRKLGVPRAHPSCAEISVSKIFSSVFWKVLNILESTTGFTKENALDYIKSRDGELAQKIILTETSSVGERGVQEVLSGGTAKDIIIKTRIGKETQIVEEIKKRIKISGLVAYGPEEVRIASDYGAIENLVIVDGELQEEREGRNLWKVNVDEIIEMVEKKGGEITILSKEYGPGGELKGLGGIAALLRFRVN